MATVRLPMPDPDDDDGSGDSDSGAEAYNDASSRRPADTTDTETDMGPAVYYNVQQQPSRQPKYVLGSSIKLPTARPRKARVPTTHRRKRFADLDVDELQFNIEDSPPWYLCIFLGFQHYLIMFGATLANVMVLAPILCIPDDDNLTKSYLVGTIFVASGVATLLQNILGVRLPIVQGGTFTFVTPSVAILSLPKWGNCTAGPATAPVAEDTFLTSTAASIDLNYTNVTAATGVEPPWMPRIREIQGAIMVASVVQVVVGFTGLVGFMLRWVGPLAVAPTIALAGLALFDVASFYAAKQWWIALVTVLLIIAFSQYSKNLQVPCFTFRRGEGCHRMGFPIFRLFPVILAMGLTWSVCAVLSKVGVFEEAAWAGASTYSNIEILHRTPWFRVPYPGQWGMPTVSMASVFGMLSAVLASFIESVGDYYACARMSGVPPPPMHAINRGIGVEGLACVLAGAFGSGSATTSYSESIGAIGITKVASRRVIEVSALFMIIFGVVAKFGAFFVTIPEPIVGGVFIVMFGMITAVGISNLQFVDLNSSRNLFIMGFSFFFGLSLPKYLSQNEGAIKTGNDSVDQIFTVLLSTSMFVGGFAGFLLDNTIPGSDEERGLIKWRQQLIKTKGRSKRRGNQQQQQPEEEEEENLRHLYEIRFLTGWLEKHSWARYIPFLHTFDESLLTIKKAKRKERRKKKKKKRRDGGNDATTSV